MLAQWQAPFRKPDNFFQWVQDQEETVGLILTIFCLYKNRFFCIGVMSQSFWAVNYPKIITAVRPVVGFPHIHCLLSPFLQNLIFCQLVDRIIPSPTSQAKQLGSVLHPGHTAALLFSLSAFQMGFMSIGKSWTNVKILKSFPNRICRQEWRQWCPALFHKLFSANKTYSWSSHWGGN